MARKPCRKCRKLHRGVCRKCRTKKSKTLNMDKVRKVYGS